MKQNRWSTHSAEAAPFNLVRTDSSDYPLLSLRLLSSVLPVCVYHPWVHEGMWNQLWGYECEKGKILILQVSGMKPNNQAERSPAASAIWKGLELLKTFVEPVFLSLTTWIHLQWFANHLANCESVRGRLSEDLQSEGGLAQAGPGRCTYWMKSQWRSGVNKTPKRASSSQTSPTNNNCSFVLAQSQLCIHYPKMTDVAQFFWSFVPAHLGH